MASSMSAEERVANLCHDAEASISAGRLEQANNQLQEASALDDNNPKVKQTWEKLKSAEGNSSLVVLCRKWVKSLDDDDGEEILDHLHQHEAGDAASERAMDVLVGYAGDNDMADQIVGTLIKNPGARRALARQLQKQPTITFRKCFAYGDDSMEGMTATLLTTAAWPSNEARRTALRDVYQLALAQLMDADLEHPDRVMKALSRILTAEASELTGLTDSDSFGVVLSHLDISLLPSLRGPATIATSKLLELSPETGEQAITDFVTVRVTKPTAESLLQAFSAAAAVFPMAPAAAAQLFLSEGFLDGFVPMVKTRKNPRVEHAALELLSAACIDKMCREGIAKFCREWLNDMATTATDSKRASLASLVLVKIEDDIVRVGSPLTSRDAGPEQQGTDLVNNFKNMIITPDDSIKRDAVEGLAYASLKPRVKEYLASDQNFLITLIGAVSKSKDGQRPALFGGLTIFTNLSMYRPLLTDEQEKLTQLRAYANTQKPAEADPLDDDAHVTVRCKSLLDAGIMALLVSCSKKATPTILNLVLQIIFALAKEQKHRGVMSQQGAVKLLLTLYDHEQVSIQQASSTTPTKQNSQRLAAHALSRILISVNPTHVFSSATALISPIRPLVSLLSSPDPGFGPSAGTSPSPPLLATFESLLALTNLASASASTADAIVAAAWPPTQDLLLSPNTLVQRAAAELACNLCACPLGIAKFADASPAASTRLHLLLALTDVEDAATRRAAGGALAMLTEWQDEVVPALVRRERAAHLLLALCEDGDDGLRHRGLICVCNVVTAAGEVGELARGKVRAAEGSGRVAVVLTRVRDDEVVGLGRRILQALG